MGKEMNGNEALVPTVPRVLAQQSDSPLGIEGLEGCDPGDLIIPRLSIIQPTSSDKIDRSSRPGQFISNLGDECWQGIDIVPLVISKGMVLFEQGVIGVSCKSDDAMVPNGNIPEPYCERCHTRGPHGGLRAVCEKASWSGRSAPDCALVYNMMALNEETKEAFFVTFQRTSIKPVKRLITYFVRQRVSPFSVRCKMVLVKTSNTKGTFYVVNFTGLKLIEPAMLYRDRFAAVRGYDTQTTFDAEAEFEAAQDGGRTQAAYDREVPLPTDEDIPF